MSTCCCRSADNRHASCHRHGPTAGGSAEQCHSVRMASPGLHHQPDCGGSARTSCGRTVQLNLISMLGSTAPLDQAFLACLRP
eukprot:1146939-Pelagomonas_calceolata.AAC.2